LDFLGAILAAAVKSQPRREGFPPSGFAVFDAENGGNYEKTFTDIHE
jgi:hypothetical protein